MMWKKLTGILLLSGMLLSGCSGSFSDRTAEKAQSYDRDRWLYYQKGDTVYRADLSDLQDIRKEALITGIDTEENRGITNSPDCDFAEDGSFVLLNLNRRDAEGIARTETWAVENRESAKAELISDNTSSPRYYGPEEGGNTLVFTEYASDAKLPPAGLYAYDQKDGKRRIALQSDGAETAYKSGDQYLFMVTEEGRLNGKLYRADLGKKEIEPELVTDACYQVEGYSSDMQSIWFTRFIEDAPDGREEDPEKSRREVYVSQDGKEPERLVSMDGYFGQVYGLDPETGSFYYTDAAVKNTAENGEPQRLFYVSEGQAELVSEDIVAYNIGEAGPGLIWCELPRSSEEMADALSGAFRDASAGSFLTEKAPEASLALAGGWEEAGQSFGHALRTNLFQDLFQEEPELETVCLLRDGKLFPLFGVAYDSFDEIYPEVTEDGFCYGVCINDGMNLLVKIAAAGENCGSMELLDQTEQGLVLETIVPEGIVYRKTGEASGAEYRFFLNGEELAPGESCILGSVMRDGSTAGDGFYFMTSYPDRSYVHLDSTYEDAAKLWHYQNGKAELMAEEVLVAEDRSQGMVLLTEYQNPEFQGKLSIVKDQTSYLIDEAVDQFWLTGTGYGNSAASGFYLYEDREPEEGEIDTDNFYDWLYGGFEEETEEEAVGA